jgi:hypothetical protein
MRLPTPPGLGWLRGEAAFALRLGGDAVMWAADRVSPDAPRTLRLGQFDLVPEEVLMALWSAQEGKAYREHQQKLR